MQPFCPCSSALNWTGKGLICVISEVRRMKLKQNLFCENLSYVHRLVKFLSVHNSDFQKNALVIQYNINTFFKGNIVSK